MPPIPTTRTALALAALRAALAAALGNTSAAEPGSTPTAGADSGIVLVMQCYREVERGHDWAQAAGETAGH